MQLNTNDTPRESLGAFEIQTIDYRKLFLALWRRKYWFVIAFVVSILSGWIYNRYHINTYRVTSKFLVEDKKNKGNFDMPMSGMTQGFDLLSGYSHFDNQLVVVQSYGVLEEAVVRMGQKAEYFKTGNVIKTRLFRSTPFVLNIDTDKPQIIGQPWNLEYKGDGVWRFYTDDKNIYPLYSYKEKVRIGESAALEMDTTFTERLNLNRNNVHISLIIDNDLSSLIERGASYRVILHDYNWWINYYKGKLNVSPVSKNTTILNFSLVTENSDEGSAFLNTLMQTVIERDLQKKNQIADNTISFIDEQLALLATQLSATEGQLETFQSENKMVKLSMQAEKIYERMQELETQKEQLDMRLRYYKYLQDYLKNRKTEGILAPSSMGIEDPLMLSMVSEINKLLDEKTVLQRATVPNLQRLSTIKAQLHHASITLQENIRQMIQNVELQKSGITQRISKISFEVQSLPEAERTYLNIQRKFKVNDNIYTYLLQRRTEASITKASNTPSGTVIDIARRESDIPVSPKRQINYLVFILLGIMVPSIAVMIEAYFFDHIVGASDMKEMVGVAPMAIIGHADVGSKPVLTDPEAQITEQFRALRVRLSHMFRKTKAPVFLFTSTLSGDGKTFVSINTALCFAALGKKTILVGADLRKPRLQSELESRTEYGLAEFLAGETSNVYELINVQRDTSMDVIFSGVYGNHSPVDLLSHGRMGILIDELRNSYDYIVLDTAPLGISFDTYNILNRADQVIFVSRSHKTPKSGIKSVREQMHKYIPDSKIGYVINDVASTEGTYGYGYGYGYGNERKKENVFHRFVKRIKQS